MGDQGLGHLDVWMYLASARRGHPELPEAWTALTGDIRLIFPPLLGEQVGKGSRAR